jgi:hypothetical protein
MVAIITLWGGGGCLPTPQGDPVCVHIGGDYSSGLCRGGGLCGLLGSLAWVVLALARAGALVGPAWKLGEELWGWVIAICVGACIVRGSA